MTEKLEDRWASRDFPVLIEIGRRLDDDQYALQSANIAASLEIPEKEVVKAIDALSPAYIDGEVRRYLGGNARAVSHGLTERGRRAVGLWPSGEAADALIDALRQAEEATDDPEERTLLRRAAGAVGSVSRDIMVDVVAAVVARQSGLG